MCHTATHTDEITIQKTLTCIYACTHAEPLSTSCALPVGCGLHPCLYLYEGSIPYSLVSAKCDLRTETAPAPTACRLYLRLSMCPSPGYSHGMRCILIFQSHAADTVVAQTVILRTRPHADSYICHSTYGCYGDAIHPQSHADITGSTNAKPHRQQAAPPPQGGNVIQAALHSECSVWRLSLLSLLPTRVGLTVAPIGRQPGLVARSRNGLPARDVVLS